jgi:hypothetical protein
MKSSCFARYTCAVVVLALGACQDPEPDLAPHDDVTSPHDAGNSVDPVEVPDTIQDAAALHKDAKFDAAQLDATMEHVEDAGAQHDAEVEPTDAAIGDADADCSTSDDASTTPGSFDSVYEVIAVSCVGCHGAGKTLDLSTRELALAGLVGVQAQYAACVGDAGEPPMRVVPGDPDSSLLIAKLENMQTCGKQMPPRALLEADKVALFRAWVAAGAQ